MTADTPSTDTPRRRKWPLVATAIVALITASGAVGKYWIIPTSARASFEETILHYWDGTIEIDRVEGGYFDPIRGHGLTLRDHSGRAWARARSVTLTYTPWPSISDQLCLSDIDGFEIILHVDDGSCRPPVRNVDDFLRWLEQQFSIEKFTIRDGSITTRYDGKTGGVWDGFEFVCTRRDDGGDYTMNLTRTGPNGHEASCDGRIDVDIEASWPDGGELVYNATARLEGLDVGQLLAAVNAADAVPISGVVRGTYVFSGTQLTPETIRGEGTLKIATVAATDKGEAPPDYGAISFGVEGPLVTVRKADLTLLVYHITATDAGWINLATGELDVRLKQRMLFAGTSNVHYTGLWNVPGKLVKTVTPVE